MEEIKINDYIRTKKGTIAKVLAYQDLTTYDDKRISVTFHSFDTDKGAIADVEIEKHSKNIKELVEAGDIVIYGINNLFTDIEIVKEHTEARTLKTELKVGLYSLEQINILKILTREKFENECFKIKEGQDV